MEDDRYILRIEFSELLFCDEYDSFCKECQGLFDDNENEWDYVEYIHMTGYTALFHCRLPEDATEDSFMTSIAYIARSLNLHFEMYKVIYPWPGYNPNH